MNEPDTEREVEPFLDAPEPRRRRPLLPLLAGGIVVLLVVLVGGGVALSRVIAHFADAPDYPGPGSGHVLVQVAEGDSSTAIGRKLKDEGVVKSVQAFTDAARGNDRSRSIQVGYYTLKKHMKAAAALAVLVDPKNLVQAEVTIPEGARVEDIVAKIVAKTHFTAARLHRLLASPKALGLPPEAEGNPEGYLFPATYSVPPKSSALSLLRQMVAKTRAVEQQLGVDAGAARLGLTPHEVITVASILEYEARRTEDYPKVARAIYNRLKKGMPLQSDATVAYANKLKGTVWTSAAQRANPSAYNTYVHPGLPPGPIGSPGAATIKAALDPTPGPWLYWLVVNLRTGETRFNTTYQGHLKDKQLLLDYCKTSKAC